MKTENALSNRGSVFGVNLKIYDKQSQNNQKQFDKTTRTY